MTLQQAIREETLRYLRACTTAATTHSVRAVHRAHIHALALGRLRGQPVAPWVHEADQYRPCGCHRRYGGCPTCTGSAA